MKSLLSILLLTFSLISAAAQSSRDKEIEQALQRFRINPAKEMNAPLPKIHKNGLSARPRFTTEEIKTKSFVTQKDAARKRMRLIKNGVVYRLEQLRAGRAGIESNDEALELVDVNKDRFLDRLDAMESQGLTHATVEVQPWSDSYWPLYRGAIGARYGDDDFLEAAEAEDFDAFYDYVHQAGRLFTEVFTALTKNTASDYDRDLLSPAEKYDLLVGDSEGLLSEVNWHDGASYSRSNGGVVERWMGLCHGWAAASMMEDRPTNAIEVTAFDGRTKIKFYPSDIKGLATSLWANADVNSYGMGGRCGVENPNTDANGRIVDQDCFDTNPGAWHMAVVNQLGLSHRSLIMDATYDYEVWNHPVIAYSYSYYNPISGRTTKSLKEAQVRMKDFSEDIFSAYRSEKAVYLVGVAMDVEYAIENEAGQYNSNSHDNDDSSKVQYMYDLELNSNGEIIGGEWHSNMHPDFLWVNPPNERATTPGDEQINSDWDASRQAFPHDWMEPASQMSKEGLPLEKVVHALIQASRKK